MPNDMILPQQSDRLAQLPSSPIRKLVPFALEAKKRGIKVYHLNIGDPDIKTPEIMLNTLRNWEINPIAYGQSPGQPNFIQAILSYYKNLGFNYLNESNIQVTSGGSEAISMAMFAVCNPGDEILVFEPFYTNYNSYAMINGVKLIPILTVSTNGFHLPTREIIEKKITKKTKAILFCSPNNPTGTVFTRQEIEMLVDIAQKFSLYLLSDEVYREFAYDGKKQTSLFEYMKKIPEQTIVLDSLSKRYSLCGARLGVLVSLNEKIMTGILKMAQGRLSAGLIDQAVGAQLTQLPPDYFAAIHKEYENRRDVLYEGLKKIPGVTIPKPEGAFYTIVDLPVKNADDFCQWLLTDFQLNKETVMLAPAAGFYATNNQGLNQVRIAYVLNVDSLKKAIKIIAEALKTYPNKT